MKEEELGLKKTAGNKARIKGFIAGESDDNENDGIEAPIAGTSWFLTMLGQHAFAQSHPGLVFADLFPHCTVYFGDIAGKRCLLLLLLLP